MSPLNMWEEISTGTNLPAQIELAADSKPGHELQHELFQAAMGGGSANKSYLFQETKAVLNEEAFRTFLDYRCAPSAPQRVLRTTQGIVVGGTSAEFALKTAKIRLGPLLRQPADPRAVRTATDTATSTWSRRCSSRPGSSGSGAVRWRSTSATMCG